MLRQVNLSVMCTNKIHLEEVYMANNKDVKKSGQHLKLARQCPEDVLLINLERENDIFSYDGIGIFVDLYMNNRLRPY